jgi:glycosidase
MPGHRPAATFEFHVAREARDRYEFDQAIFQTSGNVVFANFYAARQFAQQINANRPAEQAVSAAAISAMGLIDEINHLVFRQYRERTNPRMLADALAHLEATLGSAATDALLLRFSTEFPPVPVYQGQIELSTWLAGSTGATSHREVAVEELLMLWLANTNPAFGPYRELLFDDGKLSQQTAYPQFTPALYAFFGGQQRPGDVLTGVAETGAENLIDLLRAPVLAAPDSLEGQLAFIQGRFGEVIGQNFVYRLLSSADVIKEEGRAMLPPAGQHFGGGVGEVSAAQITLPDFSYAEPEPERFTEDREWMPNLVLIAKNAFVWLDQLSKQYQQPITTLDQIPDAELDALREAGISGLWLIGLWERSDASKRIKQIMGNHDAVASAYSLYDYTIAHDLGGEPAVEQLRQRAWQRGIRLASDMVPNHVGIDGRWVLEHPDWFVQLPYPPYPAYRFDGPDLSSDERVGIFIEDHYYDRTDASVVFKRVDRWSGETRYIYHGNDGTSMPWNDTAQLDYLKAEVREAVIQTILHVARQFPVIRFDAAMTLAKRHIHRLWYPEPGGGSDIASRAEHGLPRQLFDQLMPQEFWREVVDRCAVEAPDTLLLAEAFWMMEGYFVRTLGMHRVYNSAFMVLLRDEDNAKFRALVKNTIEFDIQIIQRFVNFLNNPDEKTAVEQFGRGEKYFGVTALMLTMPGLPMFGHGQIEGFSEKYGMEYRRAYYDEQPDLGLVAHHRRVIFPLAHKRAVFAGADNFLLYDFYNTDGGVNEDVIAYSNRHHGERSLVVYHNRYAEARGWIRVSAAFAVKTGNGDEKVLQQRTLGEGLALYGGPEQYVILRDHMNGLEYIRASREIIEQGMYLELGGYTCQVFLNIREVTDSTDGRYRRVAEMLSGRGTPDIELAVDELVLQPVHGPLRALVAPDLIRRLAIGVIDDADEPTDDDLLTEVRDRLDAVRAALQTYVGAEPAIAPEEDDDVRRVHTLLLLPTLAPEDDTDTPLSELVTWLGVAAAEGPVGRWGTALLWALIHRLGAATDPTAKPAVWAERLDQWLTGRVTAPALLALGFEPAAAQQAYATARVLTAHQQWNTSTATAAQVADALLADPATRQLLGVNTFEGVSYFDGAAYAELTRWLLLVAAVAGDSGDDDEWLPRAAEITAALAAAAEPAGYRVEELLSQLRGPASA